jgi:hypothetical protein
VELFWLGPADFSATAGYPGQWEGPGVAEQLLAVKDAVRRAGKHCGVVATSAADLAKRREQGFTALDWSGRRVAAADAARLLASAGHNPTVRASLAPDVAQNHCRHPIRTARGDRDARHRHPWRLSRA